MRWTQHTAPTPPDIDVRQRRPFTTDSRSHSRSQARIEPDNAPKVEKKEQQSVGARFRQTGKLIVSTPCDQRLELSKIPASTQLLRKLPKSSLHQERVLIGNYSNDKPHKGAVLNQKHFRKVPLFRKEWAIIEAPTSKSNDEANMGRVSAKGLFSSLDRPGLIRNGAKEGVHTVKLRQGPPIRKITLPEPLVPRSQASVEESAVPEASVYVSTYGPKDEKDMSTNMQVPTQVRKQGLLQSERASRDSEPGKEQASDKEQASKAQTLPPIEEQTTKPSIPISEAEHATKAKFQISDVEKDLEALNQAQIVDGLVMKGNGPDKLSRLKAREVAHLKESVTQILDQEATTQEIRIAEAKKAFGRFRFVTEVPKKEQSGEPYPKSVVVRKHLSVGNPSKPRLDQAPEKRRLGTRLDAAPFDLPSALEKIRKRIKAMEDRKQGKGKEKEEEKWTDEFKTDGNVYQTNLKLSAIERSGARDEPKSSAEGHSDNTRHLRHLYQDASHHPGNLPITPAAGSIAKFELGHEMPLNGYSIRKHLSETPSSVRTQPASSRDRAQDLHQKYRPHLSPDETP